MGRKKQNKRKNKKPVSKAPNQRQEVLDELLVLEAVFGEDFKLHNDRLGFEVHIVPSPSNAEINHVSLTLNVRYRPDYPESFPELEILRHKGLEDDFCESLMHMLNRSAAELLKTKDVFMFTLIDRCQESLLTQNQTIEAQQMAQACVLNTTKSIEKEVNTVETEWFAHLAKTSRGMFGTQRSMNLPVKFDLGSKEKESEAISSPPEADPLPLERKLNIAVKKVSVSSSESESDGIEKEGTWGGTVSRSMMSLVASMIDRIGPLPTEIAKFLGLSPNALQRSDSEIEGEMSKFKTEVLIGHLLKLSTSGNGGSLPKEAFPLLCAELHEKGILPDWLHWMLIKRPFMFDKLLYKFFQKEIEAVRNTGSNAQPSRGTHFETLKRFWLLPESTNIETVQSSSRYRTDFDEGRLFGKGGFGVVVAAINRLDGRLYAVKKIKLTSTSLNSYNKIIREVSTLARLQHPNVVRYFQAWLEPCTEDNALTSEDSMDLDVFVQSDSDSSSSESSETMDRKIDFIAQPIPEETSKTDSFLSATSDQWTPNAVSPSKPKQRSFTICFEPGSSVVEEHPKKSRSHRRSERIVQHQILYIQMEACNRTLHEMLISCKKLEEEERWEILRQILLGLAYIHSQHIVHRDLKPPNIFYSTTGEVKLGDFGLAKFSTNVGESSIKDGVPLSEPTPTPTRQSSTEASGICGTSFYIAPEIQNRWPSYDSKVDMYSLGIVVFEMWHPFETGMERILTLKDLKENGKLPSKWKQEHPMVAQLVLDLISGDPSMRPSARQLLRSAILPPRVGDEQLQDLIRSLEDDTETYDRVVEGVFQSSKTTKRSEGPGVLPSELTGAPCMEYGTRLEIQDRVCSTVRDVFSMHGAIPMTSQNVGLSYADLPVDAVTMLSRSGDLYALKYEMRRPFIEWVAGFFEEMESGSFEGFYDRSIPIENLRRYDIGSVSRREKSDLVLSESFLQADIDFITAPSTRITEAELQDRVMVGKLLSEHLLAEAEIIKIVTDVISAFKFTESNSIEIRLTHHALFDNCIKQIKIQNAMVSRCLALISRAENYSPTGPHRSENWMPIQVELEKIGLSSSDIRNWKRFVTKLAGPTSIILPQLLSALSNNGQTTLPSSLHLGVEEIKSLIALLQKWKLNEDQIVIDPIMSPKGDIHSSIYFEVHLIHPIKKNGTLIGFGGRYDDLLNAAIGRRRQSSPGPIARRGFVGATINLDFFVKKEMESYHPKKTFPKMASDVLVCSKSGGISSLEKRMELISHLWSNGIKAEMLHRVTLNMTAQYEYAAASGIRILVTIDEKLTSSETVRVKHLDRRGEEDVPFENVVNYIQDILQNRTHPSFKK